MHEKILEMNNITKTYNNGVIANKDVSFVVNKGEIHALMGENGAGKSTLMKILFGIEKQDSGSITFEGRRIDHLSPSEIISAGIGMVHQHFMLIESLRVYENVVLGMEPRKGLATNKKAAIELVIDISEKYNLKVDPMARVSDLSVGLKQKVEIIKALTRNARLLILDEPTAVLTPQETAELFEQLLLLKESGHTIIFISHKIKEVKQICKRLTVLRNGRYIGDMDAQEATEEEISKFMVGRDVVLKMRKQARKQGDVLLSIHDLCFSNQDRKRKLNHVNLNLCKGQIIGIAGVEGNGQNELAECIFGFHKSADGKILYKGQDLLKKSIREIRDEGVSYIPEDRLRTGVATKANVWQNLVADRIDHPNMYRKKLLSLKKIHQLANTLIQEFQIVCRNDNHEVSMLSGGNMQKLVVAREFSANPELLIANQPTRGIDVGANEFIWKKIVEQRDQGKGVLLISADLNEILELSDSIAVMCEGEVVGYFEDSSRVTEDELGLYMLGLKRQERREH